MLGVDIPLAKPKEVFYDLLKLKAGTGIILNCCFNGLSFAFLVMDFSFTKDNIFTVIFSY